MISSALGGTTEIPAPLQELHPGRIPPEKFLSVRMPSQTLVLGHLEEELARHLASHLYTNTVTPFGHIGSLPG